MVSERIEWGLHCWYNELSQTLFGSEINPSLRKQVPRGQLPTEVSWLAYSLTRTVESHWSSSIPTTPSYYFQSLQTCYAIPFSSFKKLLLTWIVQLVLLTNYVNLFLSIFWIFAACQHPPAVLQAQLQKQSQQQASGVMIFFFSLTHKMLFLSFIVATCTASSVSVFAIKRKMKKFFSLLARVMRCEAKRKVKTVFVIWVWMVVVAVGGWERWRSANLIREKEKT